MKVFLFLFIPALLLGCGRHTGGRTSDADSTRALSSRDSTDIAIAREAYLFGLPLVLMDITRRQMTAVGSNPAAVPGNTFGHISKFPDATFRDVVRPNADTYYSTAWLDLGKGPLVLSVPDTKGRYYLLPMLDAWTNVFSSPGKRTTGTGAGKFLIADAKWKGQTPPGMHLLRSPTDMVWIIGRTQVNSKADGESVVVPIQKAFRLTPLNAENRPGSTPGSPPYSDLPKGSPNDVVRRMPIDSFFNYLNWLMIDNPPAPADKPAMERFAAIGVEPGIRWEDHPFAASVQAALRKLPGETLDGMSAMKGSPGSNGWEFTPNTGRYGVNYAYRAFVAYFGLGANLPEDAVYPSCSSDGDGHPLNGANRYVLHFNKGEEPPAKAFWSLTLYGPDGYMVDNPVNRNAIGDRNPLQRNPDGSIDLYIQHSDPGKSKQSNWLPAPEGEFNLLLRIYWPTQEAIDGKWKVPPVRKLS